MANIGTQILGILSKNPAHVSYIKTWLSKYSGVSISSSQMNDIFTTLYNWYYYYINDVGYPFPVILQGGGMDSNTVKLRNEIVGASGITSSVVNQFLYAMYTGYNQGKLSAEFAFPRDNKTMVATGTTGSATTGTGTATKTPAIKIPGVRWIPESWTQPAEKKNDGTLLTYGILAAIVAGVYFFTKQKGR
jgi:hypothetical protein